MKRFYLLSLLLVAGLFTFAQQNVTFHINHKLGANAFDYGVDGVNNLGNPFRVNRLEYYVAEITLIHDGGQEIVVPDTWILVDASRSTEVPLGSFPVTSLEAVRFGIGVQASHNHLDPASYPNDHPLALQSPSMHWGWASGYFFAAVDGVGGSNFAQSFEIHALNDVNYFQQTIATSGTISGQDLVIALDANYEMAFKDIDVSTSFSNHGGTGSALKLLTNFRDFVFSAGVFTGLSAPAAQTSFSMAPNPSTGSTRLSIDPMIGNQSTFVVYDYMGRILKTVKPVSGIADLELPVAGCYMVSLLRDGSALATKRLVVTQ